MTEGVVMLSVTWCSKRKNIFEETALNASFLSSQLAMWAAQTNLRPLVCLAAGFVCSASLSSGRFCSLGSDAVASPTSAPSKVTRICFETT